MTRCVLCLPRADDTDHWLKIGKLSVSSLYLDRNQTYRGHCQLVYDDTHAAGLEELDAPACDLLMSDLRRAAGAISRVCRPQRMNYMSLNNVVAHLHWHLVPRYSSDPRWGRPIYTTDPADMLVTRVPDDDARSLAGEIARQL